MIALNANNARVRRSTGLSQDERLLSKSISAWTRGRKRPGNIEQLLLLVQVWARWVGPRENLERWRSLFDRSARYPDEHRGEAWIYRGDVAEGHVQRRGRGHRTHLGAGDYFHGREKALSVIRRWLDADVPFGRPLVVTGQPGAGKSAVLARVALTYEPVAAGGSPARCLFFHARAQSNAQLLAAIALRAGVGRPGPSSMDELLEGLRQLGSSAPTRLVLVVDALDEATTPAEAREMAKTLYTIAGTRDTRVILGSRRRSTVGYDSTSLLAILGIRSAAADNLVDLDTEAYADPDALQAFARDLLVQRDEQPHSSSDLGLWYYRDHLETADLLAHAIAERATPNFLVAALTATILALNPYDPSLDPNRLGFDPEQLPATIGEAVNRYFNSLESRASALFPQLLTAVAYARGDGFTDQLWVDVVRAITPGDNTTSGHDLNELRGTAAADFLLQTALGDDGVHVTRLFHQALVDDLTKHGDTVSRERQIVRVLTESVARAGGWGDADDYARQHTPSHALAAHRLQDLLADPDAAVHVTPGDLLRAVYALPLTRRTPTTMIVEYAGDLLANEPSPARRGDLLALAAAHLGLTHAAPAYRTTPPLHPKWAHTAGPLHRTLKGHDGDVRAVAVGRLGDRDVIVSGGSDGTVRIWDEDGNALGRPLTGHNFAVNAVAVGGLGDRDVIVSGSHDGTVRIWDQNGQAVGPPLTGHDGVVNAVAVGGLGDRDVIVSGGGDGTVQIWDQDGQPSGHPLTGHDGVVNAVAVGGLGDRDVIVSGGSDGTVRIWDQDGQPLSETLTAYNRPVNAVAVGQLGDRDVIVSGDCDVDDNYDGAGDGTVRIWDQDGQPSGRPLIGHQGPVDSVAVGLLGDRDVIVFGDDGTVRIWDQDGQPSGHSLTGHDGPVIAVAVGRLGDRDVIVSGGSDGTVRIWDQDGQPSNQALTGHDGPVIAVAVGGLGDRDVIVSGAGDGTVRIWDQDGQAVGRPLTGHDGVVNAVAVGGLGDRDVIVSGGSDGTVRIWDQNGQAVGRPLTGHDGVVNAVAVGGLGDRDVIVSVGSDGTVRIWDQNGKALDHPLTGHGGSVIAVAVGGLGDRDVIVSGGVDRTVRIWDQDGQLLGHPLTGHNRPVIAVAVGRLGDRDVIVSGAGDGTVRTWDQDGQALGHPLTGHDGVVNAVAVGRLGDRDVIVSAGDDGTVRVWDDDGHNEQRLTTYASCSSVSLFPSGEGVIVASGRSIISLGT